MDYTVEDTIHLAFTTRAFATGVPTVLAGTPVVSAYEAASAVQITAGITLGVDHDSVVGLNLLTIVATGANGYEAGKDYNLVITTGTVGGVSVVGEVVGTFSLGRSAAAVDLANATDGLGAIKTVVDAIPTTAMRGTDSAATAAALATVDTVVDAIKLVTDLLPDAGALSDLALILADTNELQTDWANGGRLDLILDAIPTTAMRGTDSALLAASAPTNFGDLSISLTTGRVDIGSWLGTLPLTLSSQRVQAHVGGLTSAVSREIKAIQVTNINTLATQVSFTLVLGSADDDAYNGLLCLVTDAVTGTQKAIGIIDDYTGATKTVTLREDPGIFTMAGGDLVDILPISKDTLAILADTNELQTDWANGGRLDLLLDAVPTTAMRGTDSAATAAALATTQADTDDIQTRLPAALVGGRMSSDVGSIAGDANAALILEALMDGGFIAQVNDAAATTTAFATDGFTEATDDHFNGRLVTFLTGALKWQQTDITGYDALGGVQGSQELTVTALTEAPANNDFFVVH